MRTGRYADFTSLANAIQAPKERRPSVAGGLLRGTGTVVEKGGTASFESQFMNETSATIDRDQGVRAFVLCGGLGTRLRPMLSDRPKSMAIIGGVPFLQLLLQGLEAQGGKEAILGILGEGEFFGMPHWLMQGCECAIRLAEHQIKLAKHVARGKVFRRQRTDALKVGDGLFVIAISGK